MDHAQELDSIDVNPLVVMDQGAVCLDAVITRKGQMPSPH
jgi:succinyl-CoA synthetase beta subunit